LLAVIQAGGGGGGGAPRRRRGAGNGRTPRQLVQQLVQQLPVRHPGLQPREHALARGQQAFVGHRLEQVIDRAALERIDRVLVVGGDEHHLGARTERLQRAGDIDTGDAGHADVEEGQVRPQRFQHLQRGGTILALGDDAQFRPQPLQLRDQRLAQQRFVLGDQGIKLHGAAPVPGWWPPARPAPRAACAAG
jgi:hypothetical protein